MGLLDQLGNLNDTQTQGLLAAASSMLQNYGPSRTPVGFGQIVGGGLEAYQGSTIAAKKRQMDEDHAKRLADYQGLQMQEMQGTLQDSATKRAHALAVDEFYKKNGAPTDPVAQAAPDPMASTMPGMGGNPRIGGPDWMQSYQQSQGGMPTQAAAPPAPQQGGNNAYTQRMNTADKLRNAGLHNEADTMEAAALKFKPEFSTEPRTALGADNKPFMYVMDKDGNKKVLDGVQPRDEMKLFDNGQSSTAYNPYALAPGQSFKKYMTPDGAAADLRARQRLSFDQKQAEGPEAPISPEAIKNAASRYNIDGTLPPMGMGKAAAAGRSAILNEAAAQAGVAGLSGDDQRIRQIGNKANSAALSKIQQQQTMVGAFERNFVKNADIVEEYSKKVDRTGVPILNKWINAGKRSVTGDPELAAFDVSVKAVSNEYAKIISGSMGNTATAQGEIAKVSALLSAAQTPEQVTSVVNLMRRETANRMKGFDEEKDSLRASMSTAPKKADPAPAAAQPAKKSAIKGQVQGGYRFKGGDPAKQENWEPV